MNMYNNHLILSVKTMLQSVSRVESNMSVSSDATVLSQPESSIQTLSFDNLCGIFEHANVYNANATFYIAGSTTRVVKKHACSESSEFLSNDNLPKTEFIKKAKCYTVNANQGGLIEPCFETLDLIFHCEYYFNMFKRSI